MSLDEDARTSDPPLDLEAAEKLDKRIERTADTAARQLDQLAELLSEAQAGQIHELLGFSSWSDYVTNRLKPITKALNREELCVLTVELYDAGMSMRAVAETVGTSKSSVARLVSQSGTGAETTGEQQTTGTDGKTYPRRNGGGRHREPLTTIMTLKRVGSTISNITGLEGEDAEKRTEICRMINELLASIQPATESN